MSTPVCESVHSMLLSHGEIVNKGHHLDLKGKFYSVRRKLRNTKEEIGFLQKQQAISREVRPAASPWSPTAALSLPAKALQAKLRAKATVTMETVITGAVFLTKNSMVNF